MTLDVDAAMAYTTFVQERHRVWEARQRGLSQPWTKEPIVATRKFTNVFRILDYGTQFIMTDLLADEPELSPADLLMRLFLYRHTGRWEAWQFFELMEGRYPRIQDLEDGSLLQIWKRYRGEGKTQSRGDNPSRNAPGSTWTKFPNTVFTGAYLVFPQSQEKGADKLEAIVDLTRRLFSEESDQCVVETFFAVESQAGRFHALRDNKGVGDFMSMQILTDYGYSATCGEDREGEFVIPGPGCIKGARALSPGDKPGDVIRWAQEALHRSEGCPEIPLDSVGGNYRKPSLMDVQNTLCEFSKYVRYAVKPVPRKLYRPEHPGPQPAPVLPAHW